ncbi:target of Myb protein 1 isoform X2 [Marmota marmota marmota]|uniref:target of Myb protein 1 isoform X2 n=1 Tax=Marmota marmota marmota TaxID=9994 RepID=UPI002093190E|nr:target of Myb protein 1 isoform X2 [Marmota marmota marmota]
MDFLLGNPFSSPVGQRIEKATDGSLQGEDWALNMEICDIINETEEGPKDAFRAVKKRIVGNKNFHEVMLALTVLETCVKNCGHRFHVLVASQDFVESVLVRTILPRNNPPTIVHDKVLSLIQSWADAFRSSPDLTGVVAVYEDLRRKGLEFPMTDLDMLSPIHTPQRIGKLRSELEMVSGNVRVMSEMLTELVPTQAEPADLELLQELHRTCRAMQQRVLELIPRIANEQLTEELLIVNDNLNNVFLRHERFERFRTGQTAKAPSEAEPAADLIDMGPDPVATGNLSSQLAGMSNLGLASRGREPRLACTPTPQWVRVRPTGPLDIQRSPECTREGASLEEGGPSALPTRSQEARCPAWPEEEGAQPQPREGRAGTEGETPARALVRQVLGGGVPSPRGHPPTA